MWSKPKIDCLKSVGEVVKSSAWKEDECVCKIAHSVLEKKICGRDGNASDGDPNYADRYPYKNSR